MRRTDARSGPSGFMTADALMGLFLLAALSTALVVASNSRQRGARQLTGQRQALAAAQEVLVSLQTTGTATTADADASVSVIRTGQRVGEFEWVQVTVERDGRRASLLGLARTNDAGGSP